MFTDSEKADIRRFCGYPLYGASPSGNMGWRFYTAYGTLEYRMDNMLPEEEAIARNYILTLRQLEGAVPPAGDNLDSDAAGGWTHNRNEVGERLRLFDAWRRRFCAFLGVPAGEGLGAPGLSLVV